VNDNLVIGDTSQLSFYFPSDYIRTSSRNIDFNFLRSKKWNKVFICIGESRKFISDINEFEKINYKLILEIVDVLKDYSNKVIVYSTCELWNKYNGPIDLDMIPDFYKTPYLESKYKLYKFIIDNEYSNVIIFFPFNFNSIFRSVDFLFGKVFDSIINRRKIIIGDTYFHRDLIHPKFVVSESIIAQTHKIIGSGRLVFVNDFIRDLYNHFNLRYEDYVTEEKGLYKEYGITNEYYLRSDLSNYSYKILLEETINDISDKIYTRK